MEEAQVSCRGVLAGDLGAGCGYHQVGQEVLSGLSLDGAFVYLLSGVTGMDCEVWDCI